MLGWEAGKPRRVLYLDAEMAEEEMHERIAQIVTGAIRDGNGDPKLIDNLVILSHADQPRGIPDLAAEDSAGRRWVEAAMEAHGCEILMLDNLSASCRSGAENEAESWVLMQNWLLRMRRLGKTVVLFHHTGKPNASGEVRQRGTSKHEDVMNTTMVLSHAQGNGRFRLSFTKHRGFVPKGDMNIQMVFDDGAMRFQEESQKDRAIELAKEGYGVREIAGMLGASVGAVSGWLPTELKKGPGRPKKQKTEADVGDLWD